MEFKQEELVEREMEIARLLVQGYAEKEITGLTGMQRKRITAHIRNMKVKLQATNISMLVKLIRQQPGLQNPPAE